MLTFKEFIKEHNADKMFTKLYNAKKKILNDKFTIYVTPGWIHKGDERSKYIKVIAKDEHYEEIGWATFEPKEDKLIAADINIQPRYRRKGIASEIYKFIEELAQTTIVKSELQTDLGKLFWTKRNA